MKVLIQIPWNSGRKDTDEQKYDKRLKKCGPWCLCHGYDSILDKLESEK